MSLNNEFPQISHSLLDFVNRATALDDPDGDSSPYINFTLTGAYKGGDGSMKQAFLDPVQNIVSDDDRINIQRDYDSLLGVASDFMTTTDISMFTIPHPHFALKNSVHIKYTIDLDNGAEVELDFHKIPNFEFGTFGVRTQIHILFPYLCGPDRKGWKLTLHERTVIYEKGIRPAIDALCHYQVSEWSSTLRGEETRARRAGGGYSWGTKLIPSDVVPDLADEIRRQFSLNADPDDLAWASRFVVLHTVRGVKHATYHTANPESAEFYLDKFIQDKCLDPSIRNRGFWYIDVAIELSSEDGECLQRIPASHHEVVRQALDIPHREAARVTSLTSSKYDRDYASHLLAVSGCRISPGVRAEGPYEAVYLQAYTTDKALLYNTERGHHAKFLTTKEVMAGNGEKAPKTVADIHDLYEKAKENNASNARLEVRVPLEHATSVLLHFNPDALKRTLVSFPKDVWWSFRLVRLVGISQVLTLQAGGERRLRVSNEALALTAASVWLFNGLHARPEDGPAARRLMDVCLPIAEVDDVDPDVRAYKVSDHQRVRRRQGSVGVDEDDIDEMEEQEDEGEESDVDEEQQRLQRRMTDRGVPHTPHGCILFRRLQLTGDVPRLRIGGPVLNDACMKFYFGKTQPEFVDTFIKSAVISSESLIGKRMTTNKVPLAWVIQPDDDVDVPLFDVPGVGDELLPITAVDDGSDVEDAEPQPPQGTLNSFLDRVWHQFSPDVICKSPNPRGSARNSYMRIPTIERRHATEDVFLNLILSELFTAVAYKIAETEDMDRAFKWLFPPRHHVIIDKTQNYPLCPYWMTWTDFVNDPSHSDEYVNTARASLRARFNTLNWVPDAWADKMWPTGLREGFLTNKGYTRWPAPSSLTKPEPAPRILIRRGMRPTFGSRPAPMADNLLTSPVPARRRRYDPMDTDNEEE
ncbi:hypothetical protein DXG01_006436 [Tephrocybe rancida]|nr:hypothetical protein DXG01_006436 [Tephrocybe rancida]